MYSNLPSSPTPTTAPSPNISPQTVTNIKINSFAPALLSGPTTNALSSTLLTIPTSSFPRLCSSNANRSSHVSRPSQFAAS